MTSLGHASSRHVKVRPPPQALRFEVAQRRTFVVVANALGQAPARQSLMQTRFGGLEQVIEQRSMSRQFVVGHAPQSTGQLEQSSNGSHVPSPHRGGGTGVSGTTSGNPVSFRATTSSGETSPRNTSPGKITSGGPPSENSSSASENSRSSLRPQLARAAQTTPERTTERISKGRARLTAEGYHRRA